MTMTDMFAMRRANGDWFALEDEGRMQVPIFHSADDAFLARLRTVEMLLFSPIALNAKFLNEITGDRAEVDFCIIDDPFAGLRRGLRLPPSQLASLLTNTNPPKRLGATVLAD